MFSLSVTIGTRSKNVIKRLSQLAAGRKYYYGVRNYQPVCKLYFVPPHQLSAGAVDTVFIIYSNKCITEFMCYSPFFLWGRVSFGQDGEWWLESPD